MVRGLLRPEARALPWGPMATGAVLGLLLVSVPLVFSLDAGPGVGVNLLRVAALCGAMAVSFALDDPARHTTGVLPVPRPLRQQLRLCLLLPPAAAWWLAVLGLARAGGMAGGSTGVPLADVTLEGAALSALALGLAAGVVRFTGVTAPGPAVVGAVLAAAVAGLTLLPDGVALFVPLGDERWDRAHALWAALLVLAAAAWAACGPEPLRAGGARPFGRLGRGPRARRSGA